MTTTMGAMGGGGSRVMLIGPSFFFFLLLLLSFALFLLLNCDSGGCGCIGFTNREFRVHVYIKFLFDCRYW